MEIIVFLSLLGCMSAFTNAASISNTLKLEEKRSRNSRNAIRGDDDDKPNPHFLFMRRAPPAEFVADLRENWVLECEAGGSPPPTIHWLRNGHVMTKNVEHETQNENNEISNGASELYTPLVGIGSTKSRLFLDCTSPRDEAEYTCVAQTPYQRVSATSHVVVTAVVPTQVNSMCATTKKSSGSPARIYMWTGNLLEKMGNDVILFCRTVGSPSPHTTWLFDDDIINANAISSSVKHHIQENGDLLIKNIDWNDMGEYSCMAENSIGRDTAVTFLYPVKNEE